MLENHTNSSTYSKGLEGVVAAQTSLSLVDGVESKLYYRGISVEEFQGACFEEIAYLLWFGKLPTASEFKTFRKRLADPRPLSPKILSALKALPPKAHPMAVLRTMISLTGLYDTDAENITQEALQEKAIYLTAVIPTILAAFYRLRLKKKPVAPDKKLSHAANFLYMMQGKAPSREMEKALDAYLILLADHGLNASTFAARVTSGTQADIYSAMTSAVGALKGDLHGSANQRAMEMILAVGEPDKAEPYVMNLLNQKKKVMGFGHRIYKNQDPRAVLFKGIAEKLCEVTGNKKWYDISHRMEKLMWEKKRIPCNVDFYSASVLYLVGFPIDFFTTVFAASRAAGWTAHVMEQHRDNRLIRPSADYIGPRNEHYLPIEKRTP